MVCGYCGTDVKAGFDTCPSCGAMLQKRVGCLGQVFVFVAILIVVLGMIPIAVGISNNSHGYLIFGLVLWAVAVGIGWMVKKRANYKWVRRL
jgi:hypothetical protein